MALYAAYGSNMDPAHMLQRCPSSPVAGTGWLPGWRLTFGGDGATLQFDTFGVNDIGTIGGDTLQALETRLIGLSGDSAYDPFQIA